MSKMLAADLEPTKRPFPPAVLAQRSPLPTLLQLALRQRPHSMYDFFQCARLYYHIRKSIIDCDIPRPELGEIVGGPMR